MWAFFIFHFLKLCKQYVLLGETYKIQINLKPKTGFHLDLLYSLLSLFLHATPNPKFTTEKYPCHMCIPSEPSSCNQHPDQETQQYQDPKALLPPCFFPIISALSSPSLPIKVITLLPSNNVDWFCLFLYFM